jgi:hypothetical protein
MPWPHKNSDGVIPKDKIVDAWGIPKWETEKLNKLIFGTANNGMPKKPLPNWAKPISPSELLKEEFVWGTGYQDKVNYVKKLMGDGVLSLDQADKLAKQLGVAVPFDDNPILIKATQPPNIVWHVDDHPVLSTAEPIKMKAIRQDIRTDIYGTAKNISHNIVLDQSRDYTESELRSMLMQGFSKITDIIINELKKEKK